MPNNYPKRENSQLYFNKLIKIVKNRLKIVALASNNSVHNTISNDGPKWKILNFILRN
jgi:hypothetical protein